MQNNISQKSLTGFMPVINTALCNKCNNCVEACVANAISEKDNYSCSKCVKYCLSIDVPCAPDLYVINFELCNSCGQCIEVCPNDAITWFEVVK